MKKRPEKPKSLEQRLFEAYSSRSGVNLSADDVWKMVVKDDAIGTRISNAAAQEAGAVPFGQTDIHGANFCGVTWDEFVEYHKGEATT